MKIRLFQSFQAQGDNKILSIHHISTASPTNSLCRIEVAITLDNLSSSCVAGVLLLESLGDFPFHFLHLEVVHNRKHWGAHGTTMHLFVET